MWPAWPAAIGRARWTRAGPWAVLAGSWGLTVLAIHATRDGDRALPWVAAVGVGASIWLSVLTGWLFRGRRAAEAAALQTAAALEQAERQRALDRERECLISALERTNAELEQFASVASHDLKAPLRGVSQLAQWLEEDLGPSLSPEQRRNLKLLHERVRRLGALVDGILSYARAGNASVPAERVDLRALLLDVVALLAPGPGTQVKLPAVCPRLFTERVQLQQVLLNLVSNALKHGGGRVEVRAAAKAGFVEVAVQDDGPGIPLAYHQRIWGMFQTLVSRDVKETSGIGLAVVRKLVSAHGGRVWLESRPGHGATFSFTWPQHPSSAVATGQAASQPRRVEPIERH